MGILWLASYPKSGNTWLRAFLANLFTNAPKPVDINQLPHFAFAEYRLEFYERLSGKSRDALDDKALNELRPAVQRYLANSNRGQTIMVKTHAAMAFQDHVPTILPEATAGALYVVRNPLDVAVSYAHHVGIDYDRAVDAMGLSTNTLATSGDFCFQLLGSWSDHVRSWVDGGKNGMPLHVVRYEDLQRQPEKAFGSIAKFLKLPKNEERLARAIRHASFKELRQQEDSTGFIEKSKKSERFFRKGEIGGWRQELTEAHVAKIIDQHREVMKEFDYLTREGTPRF